MINFELVYDQKQTFIELVYLPMNSGKLSNSIIEVSDKYQWIEKLYANYLLTQLYLVNLQRMYKLTFEWYTLIKNGPMTITPKIKLLRLVWNSLHID